MRELPVLFTEKELCCGCTACYASCTKNAIVIQEDEEGFDYPTIREELCIRCYRCLAVCPIKNTNVME